MVEPGHEVIACAPDAPAEIETGLAEIGVRYQHFPLARAGLNPLADLQTLMAIRRLFLAEHPDRVLVDTAKLVIFACLAARWAGKPSVYAMITGLGYGFGNHSLRQKLVGVWCGLYTVGRSSTAPGCSSKTRTITPCSLAWNWYPVRSRQL
jgi:hypothetical protein